MFVWEVKSTQKHVQIRLKIKMVFSQAWLICNAKYTPLSTLIMNDECSSEWRRWRHPLGF